MRAVVQRVKRAHVSVADVVVGKIDTGLCVLLGVTHGDGPEQVAKIARKIAQQRILRNTEGADDPNLRVSAEESGAPILLISQFTLYAAVRPAEAGDALHSLPYRPAQSTSRAEYHGIDSKAYFSTGCRALPRGRGAAVLPVRSKAPSP